VTEVPKEPLVPNNTSIAATTEEGRALAILLARRSIHAMQHKLETLIAGESARLLAGRPTFLPGPDFHHGGGLTSVETCRGQFV
jgi:hypothetical protein